MLVAFRKRMRTINALPGSPFLSASLSLSALPLSYVSWHALID